MTSLHKQKGIALFIAVIMLPLILVLGVLAMSNSFLGLKMIDARVLKGESNISLESAATEVLSRSDSATEFANATSLTTFTYGEVKGSVQLDNEEAIDCKRRINASDSSFNCKYLQIDFVHSFGRDKGDGVKWATNTMSVGVEQPMSAE